MAKKIKNKNIDDDIQRTELIADAQPAEKPASARKRAVKKTQPQNTSEITSTSDFSLLTDFDIDLFKAGKHFHLYKKLGAHLVTHQGVQGVYFAVWAPNAKYVAVIGNFNYWESWHSPHECPLGWIRYLGSFYSRVATR